MNDNKEAHSATECQLYLTPGEFLDGLRSVADSRRRFNLFFFDDADPDCGSKPKKNSGDEFFEEWERREDEVEAMARQHAGRLAQTRTAGIVLPLDELACAHELDDLDRRIVEAVLVHCTALTADGGWRGLTCGQVARSAADWDGSVAQSCLPRLLPDGRLAKSGIVVFRRNGPAVGSWMVGLAEDMLLQLVGSASQPTDSHVPTAALPGDILGYLASAGVELTSETAAAIKTMWGRIAHRDIIGEKWGFGKLANLPSGLCALFHGPSGTGKTLAAKHIGMALGRVVRIISATDVMDKYVGETQKNLRHVFQEAEHDGDVLLFDEADALFGRRGDVSRANERLFNAEINSALIDLERFSGICFLTTNHTDLLDPAVLRRIRNKVFFGAPDAQVRARIWRCHIPSQTPLTADVDFDRLGQEYELTGGQIANAALAAASAAAARLGDRVVEAAVSMADLEAAAECEQDADPSQTLKSIGF
jgi:hypothetical protein